MNLKGQADFEINEKVAMFEKQSDELVKSPPDSGIRNDIII